MVSNLIRNYLFPLILLMALVLGGLFGLYFGSLAPYIKPLGDIFLNLIFTAIVPLIFFSVAAAVSRLDSWKKLANIFSSMAIVFVLTGVVAALLAIIMVKLFPLGQGIELPLTYSPTATDITLADKLVGIFTVPEFMSLFSHQHILALIVFSLLVGISASSFDDKDNRFVIFLQVGEGVFMRVFGLIMYYAPIGFFAYFANLVHELGPKVVDFYLRTTIVYYCFAALFFVVVYSLYAYIAGKGLGVRLFWGNVFLPAITAVATCSSAASIPANLEATKKMGIPAEICDTTIPLGTLLHKDGSTIGGIIKIAFLFGIFHLDFSGASVLLTALGVGILVGTVMGGIPSGGMLGELLILTVYGFPSSALIAIAAISIIIDPLATMLNVTGNSVGTMLVNRLVRRPNAE